MPQRRYNVFQRVALKLMRMVFPGAFGANAPEVSSFLQLLLPGARFNYAAEVGDLWRNSAVMNGLRFLATTFTEPRPCILRTADTRGGREECVRQGHPLLELLRRPNPYYDGDTLWSSTVLSLNVAGNAYWIKARGGRGAGRPVELWWVPHWRISPQWPADGSEYISHYLYRVDGRTLSLRREDVVHLRYPMLDPHNDRLGLSPLAAVLREVFTDNEASTYTAALLRNMGVPGAIIRPKGDDVSITEEQAQRIKAKWQAQFTGEGRGDVLVFSDPFDLSNVAFTPEQLMVDKLRRIPEERIAGALGVPPIVLGFGAGLEHATKANYEQAREQAFESNIIPTQKSLASQLNTQLLPDLGDPTRERLAWDYSEVRVLQDDQNALAQRVATLYTAGIIDRARALEMLNLTFGPADRGVYHPSAGIPATAPLPEPQPQNGRMFVG